MIAGVIPVKRLDRAKSRLVPGLPTASLPALTIAMLEDEIEAFAGATSISESLVVTPDRDVAERARNAGARAMLREEPGLNPAVEAASAALAHRGAGAVLVLLGDVPGVEASDLEALVVALSGRGGSGVVLAPSCDGGTAALLRAPHDIVPARFGPESAARHRSAAESARVPFATVDRPALSVDLDRIEDVHAFLASTSGGRRSRALLESLLGASSTRGARG